MNSRTSNFTTRSYRILGAGFTTLAFVGLALGAIILYSVLFDEKILVEIYFGLKGID